LGDVSTRSDLLLLLRKHPGSTVTDLAARLSLTGMGVRRHLDALAAEGLVETVACEKRARGRPPTGWKLTAAGLELFPRRYDALALDLLEDIAERVDPRAVDAAFSCRTDKLVAEYEGALAGASGLEQRVARLAGLRDDAGYVAEWEQDADGTLVLTENNCAVHRVAERYPVVCAMELALIRRVLGPGVEVTRVSHTMAGDPVCAYRIRPHRPGDDQRAP
jgi:predicted ArsR family transcriptional regulator